MKYVTKINGTNLNNKNIDFLRYRFLFYYLTSGVQQSVEHQSYI